MSQHRWGNQGSRQGERTGPGRTLGKAGGLEVVLALEVMAVAWVYDGHVGSWGRGCWGVGTCHPVLPTGLPALAAALGRLVQTHCRRSLGTALSAETAPLPVREACPAA